MKRTSIALAGGLLALAACASPEDRFQVSDGQGFVYVDESYDLFPNRLEEGEAWRLQALGRALEAAGLCPASYRIDSRTESELEDRFGGGMYRVTYQGHCDGVAPAG